jgi:hypothetical protein
MSTPTTQYIGSVGIRWGFDNSPRVGTNQDYVHTWGFIGDPKVTGNQQTLLASLHYNVVLITLSSTFMSDSSLEGE